MKPTAVGLALVLSGVIAAPSDGKQAQPPGEPAHKVFVLTGCLTDSPAATAAFKLTDAVSVGQAPREGATSLDAKDVYELLPTSGLTDQGIARAELQAHVGKKVEVTVRPVEVVPGPSSSSSSSASATKPEKAEPPRYTVAKIKSLADSCL